MSRSCTLLGFFTLLQGSTWADSSSHDKFLTAAPEKPNIVFILADDLGFSDLGCYDSEIDTPNLDALAESGLRFTQIYNSGRCWPSRASLITGYSAQQVRRDHLPGIRRGTRATRPDWARALPEFLAPAGYHNYLSGEWHVDGEVPEAGFHRSLNIDGQQCYFSGENNEIDDQPVPDTRPGYFTTPPPSPPTTPSPVSRGTPPTTPIARVFTTSVSPPRIFPYRPCPKTLQNTATVITAAGTNCAKNVSAAFAKWASSTPRFPPLEPELGPPYYFPKEIRKFGPGEIAFPIPWADLADEQRQFQATKMAIHAAMIDCMDREIGRIIDQLEAMDAFNNTLIIFASDNGGSSEIMIRGKGHDPELPPGSEVNPSQQFS